jgi:hypothetical protein
MKGQQAMQVRHHRRMVQQYQEWPHPLQCGQPTTLLRVAGTMEGAGGVGMSPPESFLPCGMRGQARPCCGAQAGWGLRQQRQPVSVKG